MLTLICCHDILFKLLVEVNDLIFDELIRLKLVVDIEMGMR